MAGGKTINMPFFANLTGADEVLSDTGSLTPGKIGTGQDVAVLFMRGKAWAANDLAKALSGADPMRAIADQVAAYWAAREQDLLFSILKGVFLDNVANDASDLLLDLSIADGTNAAAANKISAEGIIEGAQKLGDAKASLAAIAMHSRLEANLKKLDLIDSVRNSDGTLQYNAFQGLRVIIDDGCPVVAGGTSGYVYTSYLFGQGAIGRGDGAAPVPTETDRNSLAGDDYLINRRHFLLHPRGIKWAAGSVAGSSPTNAEAALAANWDRVYDKKNIRLVAIKTNG